MNINQLEELIQKEVEKRLQQNGNQAEPKYGLVAITNLWAGNKNGYKATLKNQYKKRLLELIDHIEGFQLFPNTIPNRGEFVLYAMVPHHVKVDHDAKLAAMKNVSE